MRNPEMNRKKLPMSRVVNIQTGLALRFIGVPSS